MNKKNIIGIIFAAALMSSCGLYNKYKRPDIKVNGIVRDTVSTTDTLAVNDTTSFGNLPWKSVFTDQQLQLLIQDGIDNNVNMLNAALNVKIVEEQLKVAKLAFVPSFTFSPTGTLSSWDGNTPSKTYSMPVAASWTLDLFGNLLSVKRSAQMSLLATRDYQQVVKTKLIANIANCYYTLLMLDRERELTDSMHILTKSTWDMMKLLKNLGQTNEVSVQSAEANYYSVGASLADIDRQIREAENSLSLLLGQSAQAISRGKLEDQSLPDKFSVGIPLQMLNNRPDVHYAEMQLAECFYNVETARSKFYPSLSITATGSFTNNAGSKIINPGKILASLVGNLTQPIFSHGTIIAGLKVAKIEKEQAFNTWKNTVLSAGSEVSNALILYKSSAEKSELEAKQVESLKKSVNYTLNMYNSTSTNYLEVITAQQSLLTAQLSKIADDFYKMQAVVNLYYALGGGR